MTYEYDEEPEFKPKTRGARFLFGLPNPFEVVGKGMKAVLDFGKNIVGNLFKPQRGTQFN